MPWSKAQMRLWRAAAHEPAIARSHGISRSKARTFISEGVKGYADGGDVSRIPLYQLQSPLAPRPPAMTVPGMFGMGSISSPMQASSTFPLASPSLSPSGGRGADTESSLSPQGSFSFSPGMGLSAARSFMSAAPFGLAAAVPAAAFGAITAGVLGRGINTVRGFFGGDEPSPTAMSPEEAESVATYGGFAPLGEAPSLMGNIGPFGGFGPLGGFSPGGEESAPPGAPDGSPPGGMASDESDSPDSSSPDSSDSSTDSSSSSDSDSDGGGGSGGDSDSGGGGDGGYSEGGLAQYDEHTPMYALPQYAQLDPVPMPSLEELLRFKPLAGLQKGGYITPGDFLENAGKFAEGGFASQGSPDMRLDPRTRAIKRINDQLQRQSSTMSARQAAADITRPLSAGRSLSLPHLSNPWASQYLARTPFDTAMGYGAYPVPEMRMARGGYVDGGEVDDRTKTLLGVAGAGAGVLALRPKIVNAMTRPMMRALAKPTLGMEAVSDAPLSGMESDARYQLARHRAAQSHELAARPVHRGQGAWMGESGMEFNPLYMQEMPRTLGRIDQAKDQLRYASQMGENLEQAATPLNRFVPHAWNTSEGANAMVVSGIDRARMRSLAELLGPDVVTAHRPGNRALVFPTQDQSMEDLATEVNARFSRPKIRFGRSDPGVDRVLLTRDALGFGDQMYGDHDVVRRTPAYEALERSALKGPSRWALPFEK